LGITAQGEDSTQLFPYEKKMQNTKEANNEYNQY